MNFYAMTDKGIGAEIGSRIKSLRLRKNMTQQQVAEAAGLSLNSIKALESGKGKLSSLIAVMRELGALDSMDAFIPDIPVSPLQLARAQRKKRQRASGKRVKGSTGETTEW
ncbi:MAG: XRE family transcriptional regulator [Desulfobacteraceae bacterium]|nr:MAG: XRE family transcriptional regulator [Desulfobacteraceae bacterium]